MNTLNYVYVIKRELTISLIWLVQCIQIIIKKNLQIKCWKNNNNNIFRWFKWFKWVFFHFLHFWNYFELFFQYAIVYNRKQYSDDKEEFDLWGLTGLVECFLNFCVESHRWARKIHLDLIILVKVQSLLEWNSIHLPMFVMQWNKSNDELFRMFYQILMNDVGFFISKVSICDSSWWSAIYLYV